MKKFLNVFLTMLTIFFVTGCGGTSAEKISENPAEKISNSDKKILVTYFSRADENYNVGNISKGNTKIIAEIIAEKTGADIFEIKPVKNYPVDYDECTKIASREKAVKARPNFIGNVENFSDYDTIFLGYPIWYGDAPMIIYSFLEKNNFDGKKIIPFCTHGGSGLSSTDQQITLICPNSKILQGFEIRGTIAQKNFSEAEQKVSDWLKKINF